MPVKISAIFDTADSADLAMMHLREQGVPLSNVRQSLPGNVRESENTYQFYPGAIAANPMMEAEAPGLAPFVPLGSVGFFSNGGYSRDAISDDVLLEFTVEPGLAEFASGIIISSHGRRIRKVLN